MTLCKGKACKKTRHSNAVGKIQQMHASDVIWHAQRWKKVSTGCVYSCRNYSDARKTCQSNAVGKISRCIQFSLISLSLEKIRLCARRIQSKKETVSCGEQEDM
jgi:hypothetical protein